MATHASLQVQRGIDEHASTAGNGLDIALQSKHTRAATDADEAHGQAEIGRKRRRATDQPAGTADALQSDEASDSDQDDAPGSDTASSAEGSDGGSDLEGLPTAAAVAACDELQSDKPARKRKRKGSSSQGKGEAITEEGVQAPKLGLAFERVLDKGAKTGILEVCTCRHLGSHASADHNPLHRDDNACVPECVLLVLIACSKRALCEYTAGSRCLS